MKSQKVVEWFMLDNFICRCERTGRGTRDCVCKPGFQRFSDTDCVAINHCNDSKSICGQFATCTFEGPGMYHCHCKEGFNAIAPSSQAPNCRPINLCQNETNPCNDTSQCFFTGPALYFCEPCPNSVKINENSTCEILNPCHSGAVTCGINATCQHTGGAFYHLLKVDTHLNQITEVLKQLAKLIRWEW